MVNNMFVLQHPVTKKLVGVYVEEALGGGLQPMLVEFDPDDYEHTLFVKTESTMKLYMDILNSYEKDDLLFRHIADYEINIHNLREYVPYELNI